MALFKFDSELVVQSKQFCEIIGIPKLSLKVKQDFTYNVYPMGIKRQVSVLTKKRITLCNRWSTSEKALQFLNSSETGKKKDTLMQHTDAMRRSSSIPEQKYTPEVIARRFEYFAKTRSCYKLLKNDYELLSVSTFARFTSKVSNIEETSRICEKCFSKPMLWTKKLYFVD